MNGVPMWKSALPGAALAFACVAAALLLTQALNSVFPTPLFFAAITVSTWFGGGATGLLAVALATIVLDYYFVPPVHRFAAKAGDVPYLVQFAIPALLSCWFVKKRKDAESSLTHARDELESKVRERTAELRQANRQLRAEIAERIRAEEIVQKTQADLAHVARVTTLGELAASIAHEVNQPLMAVVINGDACLEWLAREQPDLEEAREAVGRIIAEGNRAGEIIRRIRALVRFRRDSGGTILDTALQRAAMVAYLEGALEFVEKLQDTTAGYLIKRALDEARSKAVSSISTEETRQFN